MNKKGFTLIEMLTVLIIISLIALITVSAVTSVLNSSKETLYETQKKQIESAARLWGSDNMLILPNDPNTTNICVYENIDNCEENYRKLIIDLKLLQDNGYIDKGMENPKTGERYDNVTIEIEKVGKKLEYTVIISENNYKEEILNGADPVIGNELVPVIISSDGKVKKADITKEWYKYADKKWANAVLLNSGTKYDIDAVIPESDIRAYFVWIPRYKYKIFNSESPTEINITFESSYTSKSHGNATAKWLTHPAFTYGNQEIEGFWMGKFEISKISDDTSNKVYVKPYMSGNADSAKMVSFTGLDVSNYYNKILDLSNSSTMIKNDEWAAVAYLSHSKYGTCANESCTQIRINNNLGYKTGCGAASNDKSSVTSCEIEYGKENLYPQSTTGNITGVFDMSGGASEYVMGIMADSEGIPYSGNNEIANSGFNGKYLYESTYSLTTGEDYPDSKNYNLYYNSDTSVNLNSTNACNGEKCYGHATLETGGWYGDTSAFSNTDGVFVMRGGKSESTSSAGIFSVTVEGGDANSYASSRAVIHN